MLVSLTYTYIWATNIKIHGQSTEKDAQKHYSFVTKVKVRYLKDLNKVNKNI